MKNLSKLMSLALAGAAAAFLLASCGEDEEEDQPQPQPSQLEALCSKIDGLGNAIDSLGQKLDSLKSPSIAVPNSIDINTVPEAKQADLTVIVPVHPSTLEYFDYVVHIYDNRGVECRDTIHGSYGGIVVDDWNYVDIEVPLSASSKALPQGNCYVRTLSYDNLFVTATVNVEMIPKKGCVSMDPFFFYIPKPYIFPSIHSPRTSSMGSNYSEILQSAECLRINQMSVDEFQAIYGSVFSSHCGIYDSYVGYEIFFY